MHNDELIERSPVRAVAAAVRGGLEPGQTGAIMARAGVGKSAFLVHIALNHVLRGTPVLHVSLTDGHARVRSMYDEIFTEVANAARVSDRASALVEIERNRVIHSCLDGGFGAADLARLLDSVNEVMHFRPSVVLVDGLDVADLDAAGWRAVARDRSIRLWMAVRVHRDNGPAFADLAPRFDTAVVLSPEGSDVALRVLRSGGQPYEQPEALSLDPVTMLVRPEDVLDPATTPPSPHPAACTLFSGGAAGAEAAFGEHAEKFGVAEVNFTFEGHNQARSKGRQVLSERELAAGDVSLVYVANRLHRHWDKTEILRRVLQSQWHVVSHAAQVFVVGVIQPDGTVHGGTGWSVELSKRWNKRVWVYDQEHGAWFTWNGSGWSRGVPVIETPDFAGTGTRFLNDAGRTAIAELFERSFGAG